MSLLGHSRHSDLPLPTSGLPRSTDIVSVDRHVANLHKTRSRRPNGNRTAALEKEGADQSPLCLPPAGSTPAAGGDGATPLRHRAEFLDAGHLDGITTAIAERFAELNARRQLCRWCILDAGSGTGHHLARLERDAMG